MYLRRWLASRNTQLINQAYKAAKKIRLIETWYANGQPLTESIPIDRTVYEYVKRLCKRQILYIKSQLIQFNLNSFLLGAPLYTHILTVKPRLEKADPSLSLISMDVSEKLYFIEFVLSRYRNSTVSVGSSTLFPVRSRCVKSNTSYRVLDISKLSSSRLKICRYYMYVDIAFSLNRTLQVPLLVAMSAILRNTRTQASASSVSDGSNGALRDPYSYAPLRFNVVVPPGDKHFFEEKIHSAFDADYGPEEVVFRVREFTPPDFLKDYLDRKFAEKKAHRRISRYMQYARLFLKDIFPDVTRVIYFDGDTLVLGDVRSLFAQGAQLTPQRYLAAAPQFFPAVFYFSNPFKVWSDLRRFKSSFNSGVLLTDLSYWNSQTYDLLHHYLALDAKNNYRLYHLGDETVFNLMFKDTYIPLHSQWNSCGYGQPHWIAALLRKNPKKMSVIHWSGGHHKPWQSDRVIYSDLWRSYLPPLHHQHSAIEPVAQAY